jgi:hypothetical protein
MSTRTTNAQSHRSKSRRKLSNRLQTAFLGYPYMALNSKSLIIFVSIMLTVGISLDSSQAVYLFYSNQQMFLSMEQNPFLIYFLKSGLWYGTIAWEAPLAALGIMMAGNRRLIARFFALVIGFSSVLAPLTWLLGRVLSLVIFYTVVCIFLTPIIFKMRQLLSASDRPCLTRLIEYLFSLPA